MRVCDDPLPCLLCGHSLRCEVARLAEDMARKVVPCLALDKVAHVAPQTSLVRIIVIACHRHLKDIPPDDEQGMEIVGIKELPRPLAPSAESVVAHKFPHLKELVQVSYDFVTIHDYASSSSLISTFVSP